jgi:ABC-2 type transport system permease protein
MNHSIIVLARKEFVQMVREYKVIWLPIVFILLGLTQPVVTYYLPSILEALGGGQGITIDSSLTSQKGGEVLASTLGSQFDQLGLMILAISMMGMIQVDKTTGMLAFILTRPVTVFSYLGGKLVSNYLIAAFSVALGYLTSYLYVLDLFSTIPFLTMILALLLYLVWVLFIVSFTMMISTIFHSQSIIALISIVFLIGCRIIVNINPVIDLLNPASMSKHAMELLIIGSLESNVSIHVLIVFVWISLTFFVTYYWISTKKYHQE